MVQFYLDADRGLTVTAYPVFLYGEGQGAPASRCRRIFAGCPHREPGKAAAGNLSGTRERQARALQHFRGEALFQLLEEGHSRPAGHGRGVPDRCLPQPTSRPA